MDQNLLALAKSSIALWAIAACSVAALGVAIERAIALWRFTSGARSLASGVVQALERGDPADARARCRHARSPSADVFLAALTAGDAAAPGRAARPPPPDRVAAVAERARQELNLRLRQNLWALGTIGAVAPFIGLYGTVVGIMQAFHQMSVAGQGGYSVVARGISEALVTTAAGIAVAVEAVVIYNALNTHVQKLAVQFKLVAEEFLEAFHDTAGGTAPPPGEG